MNDLYFMRNTFHGCVKIGRSANVESRRAAFQTAGPGKLEVLAVIRGAGDLEPDLHHAFEFERVGGEWFEPGGMAELFARAWKEAHSDLPPPDTSTRSRLLLHHGCVMHAVGTMLSHIGLRLQERAMELDAFEVPGV